MIYIIIKEGVYRHEIKGLWHYKNKAIKKATELIEAELDDYHTFDVYSAPVEALLRDVSLVASVSRRNKKVIITHYDGKNKHLQTQSNTPF